MVNYECGFSQSELGKYFEWIIIINKYAWFSNLRCIVYLQLSMSFKPLSPYIHKQILQTDLNSWEQN